MAVKAIFRPKEIKSSYCNIAVHMRAGISALVVSSCSLAHGLLLFLNPDMSGTDKGCVIFYQEGGSSRKLWGDQVLFLRSKGGIKRFFK